MDYLFAKCKGKKTVLVSSTEILQSILPRYEITAKQLDNCMRNLYLDGYIEVNQSDDKGKLVYVVTLKQKGQGYGREKEEIVRKRWRSIGWKVLLSLLGVVIATTFWAIFRR